MGRSACIALPVIGTITSLICLIVVGLGGTNHAFLNNLYFFRANTSQIHIKSTILNLPGLPASPVGVSIPGIDLTHDSPTLVARSLGIKDFYHVSLWNYCSGDFKNGTDGVEDHVIFCSPRQNHFWFNPVDIWKLNHTVADKLFSKELKAGLNKYKIVTNWMFVCYIAAVLSTIIEILIGLTALMYRLGSVVTTIVSIISSLFLFAFALTSTILYSTLVGTFNFGTKENQIHTSLGKTIYIYTWLAVGFSMVSGFFWLVSSCC